MLNWGGSLNIGWAYTLISLENLVGSLNIGLGLFSTPNLKKMEGSLNIGWAYTVPSALENLVGSLNIGRAYSVPQLWKM